MTLQQVLGPLLVQSAAVRSLCGARLPIVASDGLERGRDLEVLERRRTLSRGARLPTRKELALRSGGHGMSCLRRGEAPRRSHRLALRTREQTR